MTPGRNVLQFLRHVPFVPCGNGVARHDGVRIAACDAMELLLKTAQDNSAFATTFLLYDTMVPRVHAMQRMQAELRRLAHELTKHW